MLAKPESTLLYPRTVDIEAMLRTEMVTEETKIMQEYHQSLSIAITR